MKTPAMEDNAEMISRNKRKFRTYLESGQSENFVSPAASWTSDSAEHDESSYVVKTSLRSPDLENIDSQLEEEFEREICTSLDSCFSRVATTPTDEHCGDSEEVLMFSANSTHTNSIPRRKIPSKMPSAAELEEFFTSAEKYEQKRFIEKYNYDVVNDVPLEGKYQWVRLQL